MQEQANTSSTQELVEAAQMGSDAALERLIEQYFRIVYAVAYARLGQREAAEDLSQEVFLSVFLNLSRLKNPKVFGPWVTNIARNAAHDWLDKGWRQSKLISMVPLDEKLQRTLADEREKGRREQMELEERNQAVRAAILRLPLDQRELVLMRYIEGLSASVIAERTGVHAKTVRRQLDKAVAQLKASVEALLSDAAPSIRAPKSAHIRTLAILTGASALSATAKSTLTAATVAIAEQSLASASTTAVHGAVSASFSAKTLALLKTIPIAGSLVSETATGGLIMTLKAKTIASCLIALILGTSSFWLRVQSQPEPAKDIASNSLAISAHLTPTPPPSPIPVLDSATSRPLQEANPPNAAESTSDTLTQAPSDTPKLPALGRVPTLDLDIPRFLADAEGISVSAISSYSCRVLEKITEVRPLKEYPQSIQHDILANGQDAAQNPLIKDYSEYEVEVWAKQEPLRHRSNSRMITRRIGAMQSREDDPKSQFQYPHRMLMDGMRYYEYDTRRSYTVTNPQTKLTIPAPGLWLYAKEDLSTRRWGEAPQPTMLFHLDRGNVAQEIGHFFGAAARFGPAVCKPLVERGANGITVTVRGVSSGKPFFVRYEYARDYSYLPKSFYQRDSDRTDQTDLTWTKFQRGDKAIFFPSKAARAVQEYSNGKLQRYNQWNLEFRDVKLNDPIPDSVFTPEDLKMDPNTLVLDRAGRGLQTDPTTGAVEMTNSGRNYPLSELGLVEASRKR